MSGWVLSNFQKPSAFLCQIFGKHLDISYILNFPLWHILEWEVEFCELSQKRTDDQTPCYALSLPSNFILSCPCRMGMLNKKCVHNQVTQAGMIQGSDLSLPLIHATSFQGHYSLSTASFYLEHKSFPPCWARFSEMSHENSPLTAAKPLWPWLQAGWLEWHLLLLHLHQNQELHQASGLSLCSLQQSWDFLLGLILCSSVPILEANPTPTAAKYQVPYTGRCYVGCWG